MRTLIPTLLFLFFTLAACGQDNPNSSAESALEALENSIPENDISGGTSCLATFEGSLCELLDEEIIQSYFPGPVERKGYKDEERSMLSGCQYTYTDESKTVEYKIGKNTMNLPADYNIRIGAPKVIEQNDPTAYFNNSYKTLTEAEKKDIRDKVEAGMKAKLDKGEITQEQYDMGKGFGKLAGAGSWEKVEGLGNAAAWGRHIDNGSAARGVLAVLHQNVSLEIEVDAIESREKSRELAIAVARKMLERCD